MGTATVSKYLKGKGDGNAINHCGMRDEVKFDAKLSPEDFNEEVMKRAEEIVVSAHQGITTKPHKVAGVELVAYVVAQTVIREGARQVAEDVGSDLERLEALAKSEHISFC